jgi:protein involved in polysaccharide export with SLBB domain
LTTKVRISLDESQRNSVLVATTNNIDHPYTLIPGDSIEVYIWNENDLRIKEIPIEPRK